LVYRWRRLWSSGGRSFQGEWMEKRFAIILEDFDANDASLLTDLFQISFIEHSDHNNHNAKTKSGMFFLYGNCKFAKKWMNYTCVY
jgi:hypothetical protein